MNPSLKKKLPNAPTKKEAVRIFLRTGRPERYILKTINSIIKEKRGLEKDSKIFCKNIFEDEFNELVETFGIPKGYEW